MGHYRYIRYKYTLFYYGYAFADIFPYYKYYLTLEQSDLTLFISVVN